VKYRPRANQRQGAQGWLVDPSVRSRCSWFCQAERAWRRALASTYIEIGAAVTPEPFPSLRGKCRVSRRGAKKLRSCRWFG